jgi:hypothetical protein
MSGFPKKASQASKPAGRTEPLFELPTVVKMLPLVRQISADLTEGRTNLLKLRSEGDRLDRQRRDLSWPERQRRYAVHDAISEAERRVRSLVNELENLGVVVIDVTTAQLGFPTIVNNKLAFFSWLPGEDTVAHWHYDDDFSRRRPVPEAWYKPLPQRTVVRRKG